jgi:hypothetical protein
MSSSACTEQKAQQPQCVFQNTFRHVQILSGGRSKDSKILEALRTPFNNCKP